MDGSHRHRVELLVAMQLRRFALGQNPLRRKVDRIEAGLLISVVLAGLLMIPAALALGSMAHGHGGVAIVVGLLVFAWSTLVLVFRLARDPLDRYRLDAWAREWRKVSPRWTRPGS
jgi:hypothetical protein